MSRLITFERKTKLLQEHAKRDTKEEEMATRAWSFGYRLVLTIAIVGAMAFGVFVATAPEADAGPLHEPHWTTVCWDGFCGGGERELYEWMVERYCHPYDYGVYYEPYGGAPQGFSVDYAGTYGYGTTRKYRIYSWRYDELGPSYGVQYEATVYVRMPGCDMYSIYLA